MSGEHNVVYLHHPVSAKEKAKHKGKRILDAKFAPPKPAKSKKSED